MYIHYEHNRVLPIASTHGPLRRPTYYWEPLGYMEHDNTLGLKRKRVLCARRNVAVTRPGLFSTCFVPNDAYVVATVNDRNAWNSETTAVNRLTSSPWRTTRRSYTIQRTSYQLLTLLLIVYSRAT